MRGSASQWTTRKTLFATVAPLAILGAAFYRVKHEPADHANYKMVYPKKIPGWESHEPALGTIFEFKSAHGDALMKAAGYGMVSKYKSERDLSTEDLAENLMLSAQRQKGWVAVRKEDEVVVDGTHFRLVRRNAPTQMMLDAVSARGNDFFEVALIVHGPRARQEALLESYRPQFMNMLTALKFQQVDLSGWFTAPRH